MQTFSKEILAKLDGIIQHSKELRNLLDAPEISADTKLWRKYEAEYISIKELAEKYEKWLIETENFDEYTHTMNSCDDEEMKELLAEELIYCENSLEKTTEQIKNLLSCAANAVHGEVLVEIKNAGNTVDCELFVEQLGEMYSKFCEKQGFEFSVAKKDKCLISFIVSGLGVFQKFEGENGLHIANRFEDKFGKQSQTAMVLVIENSSEAAPELNEKDIRIDIFHSSGAGGQNVNKVETAVRITHIPTGVVVVCQDERSQLKNKRRAMENLQNKLNDIFVSENEIKSRKNKKETMSKAKTNKVRTYDFDKMIAIDCHTNAINKLEKVMDGEIDSLLFFDRN